LGKDWNWEKVTFNDVRKKDYERLFTLPPEMRAKDAAYQGLSAEDRKVVESLTELPAPQRTDAMLDLTSKQSFQFYRDALALRQSSPAFRADSVMAFTRKSGGKEYLVVGSMNRENLKGYALPPPPGNWKEVLNSDAAAYGEGTSVMAGAPWGAGTRR
jgi:maltooligosyltrehalose trehalohydrolase